MTVGNQATVRVKKANIIQKPVIWKTRAIPVTRSAPPSAFMFTAHRVK